MQTSRHGVSGKDLVNIWQDELVKCKREYPTNAERRKLRQRIWHKFESLGKCTAPFTRGSYGYKKAKSINDFTSVRVCKNTQRKGYSYGYNYGINV